MGPPIDTPAARRETQTVSTNPKLMDIMGTRPAGQGGPAPDGQVPENRHRGQHHNRYHRHQPGATPAPFHPQRPNAFDGRPGGQDYSAPGS